MPPGATAPGSAPDELGGINAQAAGQLEPVVQADVGPSALDLTQERPVDTYLVGHRLPAQAESMPSVAHAFPENPSGI